MKTYYNVNLEDLKKIMLDAINTDRKEHNLRPVSPNENLCGQFQANSMVSERFFSHWDRRGISPLARYNRLGGHAYIAENISIVYWSLRSTIRRSLFKREPGYSISVSQDELDRIINNIRKMEYNFIHNDKAHQNLHRENILDRYHNKISLGISLKEIIFNGYAYLIIAVVQDFENYFTKTSVSESPEGIYFHGDKSPKISISYGIILGSIYEPAPLWTSHSNSLVELDQRQRYNDGEPVVAMSAQNMIITVDNDSALETIPIEIKDMGEKYDVFVKRSMIDKFTKKNQYYSLVLYDEKYTFPIVSHTLFL